MYNSTMWKKGEKGGWYLDAVWFYSPLTWAKGIEGNHMQMNTLLTTSFYRIVEGQCNPSQPTNRFIESMEWFEKSFGRKIDTDGDGISFLII